MNLLITSISFLVSVAFIVWLLAGLITKLVLAVLNWYGERNDRGRGHIYDDTSFYRRKKRAETRARKLLKEWSTPEQFKEYKKSGTITVRGGTTGSLYSVGFLISKVGCPGSWFCFLPSKRYVSIPLEDIILARVIMLQCDEMRALKVANGNIEGGGTRDNVRFERLSDYD